MRRYVVLAAFIVLTAASRVANAGGQAVASGSAAVTTYNDFMGLNTDQRRHRFDAMSPENKAVTVQTHAKQWLQLNRGRLTTSEATVFDELIAFITPELYRWRADAALDSREESLRTKMRCRVHPEDVREAMGIFGENSRPTSSRPTWTYLSKAQCWVDWILEGFAEYIPTR